MANERITFQGGAGDIETRVDKPEIAPRGIALIGHPHPLFGGSADNKVVQTLARTFVELGYIALRPNFRGVGRSQGAYDNGIGETDDMLGVVTQARALYGEQPIVLAGFSFGAFVATRMAQRMQPQRMVLVSAAAGRMSDQRDYDAQPVPADTIVIHGELDDTVPLTNVLDWARPQELPIVVVPGAEHFFHRRLHIIQKIVLGAWRP